MRGWVEATPPGFVFAVKMSRYVTHIRRLSSLESGIPRFYEPLEPLPPLAEARPCALAAAADLQAGRRASAPRRWRRCRRADTASSSVIRPGTRAEVYELLRAHGAALVIPDSPKYPFRELELTADWTFVRFHHGTRGRNGNYSETEIAEWAERIDGWREGGIDVYAYYNNDWEGYAVRNGLRLRELLGV